MRANTILSSVVSVLLLGTLCACAPANDRSAGQFVRSFSYSGKGNRFRVNSPDTATGKFRDRREARQTGRMAIDVQDDLSCVGRADLYLELWGGHPGVADKRFTLNDGTSYSISEVGAARKHCTYSYPLITLKRSDLQPGENVFQFTCDKGSTFWGHYLIRAACVRLTIKPSHPRIAANGLNRFSARVAVESGRGENLRLSLKCPAALRSRIASVEYWGRYAGYDENGDMQANDWHGFTKDLRPLGIIALSTEPPFAATWDLSMLPDQNAVSVRAVLRFKEPDDLFYVTTPTKPMPMPKRDAQVRLLHAENLPRPFWSRAGREKTCTFTLDEDPSNLQRAQLHIVVWDGGRGNVAKPLSLNGQPLDTPSWQGMHDLHYTIIDIAPSNLKRGANNVTLLSDTHHHGIEVCRPGPALLIRTKSHHGKRLAQYRSAKGPKPIVIAGE